MHVLGILLIDYRPSIMGAREQDMFNGKGY